MNREHELPADRTPEPEPIEQWERLAEIERRLKKARPRPPKLDMAALEQLANSPLVDPAVEKPAGRVNRRRRWNRSRRSYRGMAVVAGSWACGVVVGALAVFLLMSRSGPDSHPAERMAQHATEMPVPAAIEQNPVPEAEKKSEGGNAPIDPSPSRKAEPLDESAAVLAMIIDKFGNSRSAYWPDGLTLRAGMHLNPLAESTSDAGRVHPRDAEPRHAEAPRRPRRDFVPHAAMTRERLLEDLLSEMPGSVL